MPISLPHTLTAGTPENINDVASNFTTLETAANDTLGVYKTIFTTNYRLIDTDAGAGGTTTFSTLVAGSGGSTVYSGSGGTGDTAISPMVFPFDPADYSITGATTQLRLRMSLMTNATASGKSFTGTLKAITAVAGSADQMTLTMGSAITGSTVSRATPSASTAYSDVGSDFAAPAAGTYALSLGSSPVGAIAANSIVVVQFVLQYHHV